MNYYVNLVSVQLDYLRTHLQHHNYIFLALFHMITCLFCVIHNIGIKLKAKYVMLTDMHNVIIWFVYSS